MKTKLLPFCTLLLISSNSFAEFYTPFAKITVGRVLDQTDRIWFVKPYESYDLYTNDHHTYTLEAGYTKYGNTVGVSWSDFIAQERYKDSHRPYKLEVFTDKHWYYFGLDFRVGVGFKIAEDRKIKVYQDGELVLDHDQYRGSDNIPRKLTARFSVEKVVGEYSVGLSHHSQWLSGKPVNANFEYQKTEVTFSYTFTEEDK